jgi:hypothetical protein
MLKIRHWTKRRRVVWSEPQLPPYVKINPAAAEPSPRDPIQPGDISMGAMAQEFIDAPEEDAGPLPE